MTENNIMAAMIAILAIVSKQTNGYTLNPIPFAVLKPPIDHPGPPMYFGYAQTQIIDRGSLRMLISAPITRTLYECSETQCEPFRYPFEHISAFSLTKVDSSDSWFGASMESVRNTSVVVCEPRLKHVFNLSLSNVASIRINEEDMPGICHLFNLKGPSNQLIKTPGLFDWNLQNFNKEGFGLFGFSIALSHNQNNLIVGVPGSYYFRGQIYSIPLGKSDEIVLRKKKWVRVPERESDDYRDDWCYRGYKVVSLELTDKRLEGTAASVPRLSNYTGAVEIYNTSLSLISSIRGHQVGSYFGYSLLSVDIDGDSLSDLVIGSPFFTNGEIYDCGRIDVYRQNTNGNFMHSTKVIGKVSRGRFGSHLESIGDVNEDGFQDLAVSQPYGESPSVHIFFGSSGGLVKDTKQIIKSDKESFGYSLKSFQMNNNSILSVSSIKSDVVYLYRTKSILSIEKGVIFTPNHITPWTKMFNITICMRYRGSRLPESVLFQSYALLDANSKLPPRLVFESNERLENLTISLQRSKLSCFTLHAKISTSGLVDKLSPVKFVFNYSLSVGYDKNVVLNQSQSNHLELEIPIEKSCGADGVCVPDLSIVMKSNVTRYKYSPRNPLNVSITVRNQGEDAFESKCVIQMPPFIHLTRITFADELVWCEFSNFGENKTLLSCDLGNPMTSNESRLLWIQLQPTVPVETLHFIANTSSKNAELTENSMSDNIFKLSVPVDIDMKLNLKGHTEYDQIYSGLNRSHEIQVMDDIGSAVVHVYKATNAGPVTIKKMKMVVRWPSRTADGLHHLLYLSEPPILSRPQTRATRDFCEVSTVFPTVPAVNPLGIMKKRSPEEEVIIIKRRRFHTLIDCQIFDLEPNENVLLNIRSRLWEQTIPLLLSPVVSIMSECEIRILAAHTFNSTTNELVKKAQVETVVYSESRAILTAMPDLWVIIIAVCTGVLFLSLLVLTLWCCGFFRRIPRHYGRYHVMDVKDDEDDRMKRIMTNDDSGCILRAYERQMSGGNVRCPLSANSTIL
ncbi:hypothetical protein ACOME3_008406 [Neoechinorhynchus agilis]